jgi:hypothetical protein
MKLSNFRQFFFLAICLSSLLFPNRISAQQYKTVSDTARLNKEYGEISLEISKLNTRLISEQNKTADFHSKTASAANDATATAQASKDQANLATDGNTTDTKKAVTDAKSANKKANDSKNAIKDESQNGKIITQLTAQIDQKKKLLRDLDSQRAAIMAGISSPATVADSSRL